MESLKKKHKPNYQGWSLCEDSLYDFNGKELKLKQKTKNGSFNRRNKKSNSGAGQ